ncbi:uncharacterized protein FFFS_06569 [Fusarium fujikuroi]|nr:uncharacterized protein FFFS_06569 [Fusarium fujikuroi]
MPASHPYYAPRGFAAVKNVMIDRLDLQMESARLAEIMYPHIIPAEALGDAEEEMRANGLVGKAPLETQEKELGSSRARRLSLEIYRASGERMLSRLTSSVFTQPVHTQRSTEYINDSSVASTLDMTLTSQQNLAIPYRAPSQEALYTIPLNRKTKDEFTAQAIAVCLFTNRSKSPAQVPILAECQDHRNKAWG